LPTFRPGLLVLQATLQATHFRLAGLPLAFAISHATHGLAALVATVVCGGSMRSSRGLETAGPIADRPERNSLLRDHAPPRGPSQTAKSLASSFADAAPAPPARVSPDPRLSLAAYAAAWPPAIAVAHANSRALGSTVASSVAPGNSARSLCAGRYAIPTADLWSRHALLSYAEHVPWEVVAPLGAARGGSLYPPRAPTHSRSDPTAPLRNPALPIAIHLRLHASRQRRRRNSQGNEGRRTQKASPCAARNQAGTKETGKETVQIDSGLKGNNEGDGWANPCC
jgi:hypothetical protein